MIEEKTIKVYEYNDLNEKAKEKALNWFIENNNYDFLSDNLEEDLKEFQLKDNKIKLSSENNFKIYYSLGYSQGDGFCFTGYFKYKQYNVCVDKNNNQYNHKYTTDFYITTLNGNDAKEKVYEEFKEIYFKICDELEKIGYSYIEFEDSEENFIEMSNANDFKFLEDGSFWKF